MLTQPHPVLSIIIVTYNSGEIFARCLETIPAGAGSMSYELIVVDNQSSDGTLETAARLAPDAVVIANPDNRGFAAANNQGLASAQGEYLLLMNPDVLLEPDALATAVAFMREHPRVGVSGARAYDINEQIALTAYGEYTPLSILWNFLGIARVLPNLGWGVYRQQCLHAQEAFTCAWTSGSFLLISRAAYEQIGGLDERLFLFAEEPDYCDRLRQAGWTIMLNPKVVIHHHESTTISRYPLIKMRHYHLSSLYYFRKRERRASVWILKAGFTLEMGMKWAIRAVQALAKDRAGIREKLASYPQVIREVWQY